MSIQGDEAAWRSASSSTRDPWASRAIAGLAVDSRRVAPGDVFFALAGANDDGLRHVGEAVARGAAAVVAERRPEAPGAVFVEVADARAALARAASRFYPRRPATIVAVTGTSGKTSVAAFVRQIWGRLGSRPPRSAPSASSRAR